MSLLNLRANARTLPLASGSVQCVITSPPYWGLRKYSGDQECVWGGAPLCRHNFLLTVIPAVQRGGRNQGNKLDDPTGVTYRPQEATQHSTCKKCGAWRGAFGLELTIERYIEHTVEILREIRRVLRSDGVVFWNIGDSYADGGRGSDMGSTLGGTRSNQVESRKVANRRVKQCDIKPKDLCLIPHRVAIAAQLDGWWVRSMIVWTKPNPMPESCTDRPTDAYEHIIMLTKSRKYFWDATAVREKTTGGAHHPGYGNGGPKAVEREKTESTFIGWAEATRQRFPFRNLRNVWSFATQPYKGAHFATFPEELPRRCILAATSERGACAECGTPWERILEKIPGEVESFNGSSFTKGKTFAAANALATVGAGERTAEVHTVGWKSVCDCKTKKTKPCVVLDPFGGSGTTARVAIELNRNAVSVDLAYHDHSATRTTGVQRVLAGTYA